MNNETNPKGSAMAAFLIGALAGGITALLFAPQTGAQMRGRLKRGAHDLRDRGKHLAHEVGETAGAMKGAAAEAKGAYRDEFAKQRQSRAASGQDTKLYGETETGDPRPRTSV
ncbi:MAG: YtxH domain-containing protein [Acidobacteria bacterium]|nr:MAG: YtxH domain-containing protein [Acidobacteriota bacterium]